MGLSSLLLSAALFGLKASALNNGLARTPQMGWVSHWVLRACIRHADMDRLPRCYTEHLEFIRL
jgi:hypothetical protein